jgi:hypothetical protein
MSFFENQHDHRRLSGTQKNPTARAPKLRRRKGAAQEEEFKFHFPANAEWKAVTPGEFSAIGLLS